MLSAEPRVFVSDVERVLFEDPTKPLNYQITIHPDRVLSVLVQRRARRAEEEGSHVVYERLMRRLHDLLGYGDWKITLSWRDRKDMPQSSGKAVRLVRYA
jgi:hypothetical protein